MELLGPAPGDLANFGEHFGAAAFESMRGAEFADERQSARKPIDGDDRIAACDPATTPRMESVSSVSAAQGPKVRGLVWEFFCQVVFGLLRSLFGAERPFLVPSPAIRFAERAERCQGTEMLAQLSGLPLSVACVFAAP